MTKDEFNAWLLYHRQAFTGFGAWCNKLANLAETLNHWERALADVDLDAAKHATDLMHRGDEPEPKGWDRHPAAIRAIALRSTAAQRAHERSSGPRMIDGHQTYRCPRCEDGGWLRAYRREAHHFAQTSQWAAAVKRYKRKVVAAVPCCCSLGAAIAKANRLEQFDPNRDIAEEGLYYTDAEIPLVEEAANKAMQWNPDRPVAAAW